MSSVEHGYIEDTTTDETAEQRTWLPWALAAATIIAVAIVGAWLLLGSRAPGENSVEAGFARDMAEHHDQAVEMALIILQRTDDEELRILATDIMLTQQAQIGQMRGWLDTWGLHPVNAGPKMEWMGHSVTGRMPGMATREEVDQLQTLPVDEAEDLFLQLMIVHHVAGVEMADAALERTDNDAVTFLATTMSQSQQAEIDYMQQLLEERGLEREPIEDQTTDHHDHP